MNIKHFLIVFCCTLIPLSALAANNSSSQSSNHSMGSGYQGDQSSPPTQIQGYNASQGSTLNNRQPVNNSQRITEPPSPGAGNMGSQGNPALRQFELTPNIDKEESGS